MNEINVLRDFILFPEMYKTLLFLYESIPGEVSKEVNSEISNVIINRIPFVLKKNEIHITEPRMIESINLEKISLFSIILILIRMMEMVEVRRNGKSELI